MSKHLRNTKLSIVFPSNLALLLLATKFKCETIRSEATDEPGASSSFIASTDKFGYALLCFFQNSIGSLSAGIGGIDK